MAVVAIAQSSSSHCIHLLDIYIYYRDLERADLPTLRRHAFAIALANDECLDGLILSRLRVLGINFAAADYRIWKQRILEGKFEQAVRLEHEAADTLRPLLVPSSQASSLSLNQPSHQQSIRLFHLNPNTANTLEELFLQDV